MMVTVPEYFTRIIDQIQPEFVPHQYVAHVRIFLKSGMETVMELEDFEMFFDVASSQGEDVTEYLMADKIALVIDYNKVFTDVQDITNSLLRDFGPGR